MAPAASEVIVPQLSNALSVIQGWAIFAGNLLRMMTTSLLLADP